MYPELFQIPLPQGETITVSAYRFFGLAAAGYLTAAAWIHLRTYDWKAIQKALLIAVMAAAFLAGSRILYVLLYMPEVIKDPQMAVTFQLRNFTLYGGLLLTAATWWYVGKKGKIPFFSLTDALAPHMGISLAIMRLGCFLNGCCYGRITHMPWGIDVPFMSQAHLAQVYHSSGLGALVPKAVHPTQIYEIMAALAASLGAGVFLKKTPGEGLSTAIFCLLLSAGRLITFFFREFPVASDFSNLIRGPVIYGLVIAAASIWIWGQTTRKISPGGSQPPGVFTGRRFKTKLGVRS